MASEQGNLEIVEILVKGGANVDLKDKVQTRLVDLLWSH